MLKKLLEFVANRRKQTVDPAVFEDDIALRTQWTPLKRGGTNFKTHKLSQVTPYRVEFTASWGAKIFYSIFLLAGLGVIATAVYQAIMKNFDKNLLFLVLFGLVFGGIGGAMMYFGTKPIIFDKMSGHFWKGSTDPNISINKNTIKVWTPLANIHALQIIREYVHGNKSSYYSYELNLVLKDASRINVIDHGNLNKLREDTDTLRNFLNVPIWDVTT